MIILVNMNPSEKILLELFANFVSLSETSKRIILDNIGFTDYPKNTIIFSEEKNNTYEYFVIDGIAHRYNISEEGEYITTGFYYPMSVVTPNFARTKGARSIFTLQALTDCILAQISVTTFDHLRQTNPDIRLFGQQVVERQLSKSILNETIFRSSTAKQRLELARNEYPNLENLVPHNIIASFLGITPVSFSRLRNDLASRR
jgi:CRP-like cAMP-binding protein